MDYQRMVDEFHIKNGYSRNKILSAEKYRGSFINQLCLWVCSTVVFGLVRLLQRRANRAQKAGDCRLYRVLLCLEETAEITDAMRKADEVGVFDGSCDLLYVTFGLGVTYDFPLKEGFFEVHKANMSKKKRDPNADPRMRDKGNWEPPNMIGVLHDYKYGIH